MVQQEPVLFNKSIRENIIFGREEQLKNMNNGNIDELIQSACDESYNQKTRNPQFYKNIGPMKNIAC